MLLRIFIFVLPIILFSQENDLICGTWLEEKKQSHIEINKTKDNLYKGRIIWLAEPLDENGNIKTDTKNPNKSLRNQTIEGLVVIDNLKFNNNNTWSNGTIYDARSGKTYSLSAKLEDENTLFMRGFIGFSLIGKTTRWTRVK